MGQQCNDTCRGKDNHDPEDGYKASRFLADQAEALGQRCATKLQVCRRSQAEFAATLKQRNIPLPPPVDKPTDTGQAPYGSTLKPRRDPPRAPYAGRGGGVTRQDQVLKKHQYSAKLSAMSRGAFEQHLDMVMADPRFSELFVIEDDNDRAMFDVEDDFDPLA
jgi:hypothetical protein